MITNDLLLLSGNDIPFARAGVTVHQPTVKEIAYIGEKAFFSGCELLKFSKEDLIFEGKSDLEQQSNFQIFMRIINDKQSEDFKRMTQNALLVMQLLFPYYLIDIKTDIIYFLDKETQTMCGSLNDTNFEEFRTIIEAVLSIGKGNHQEKKYDPIGVKSKYIAEKLKKANQKLARQKSSSGDGGVQILSKYTSIVAAFANIDLNAVCNYTIYQLFDQFERLRLRAAYDMNFKVRLAGAKDVQEPEDWMKDIHHDSEIKNSKINL